MASEEKEIEAEEKATKEQHEILLKYSNGDMRVPAYSFPNREDFDILMYSLGPFRHRRGIVELGNDPSLQVFMRDTKELLINVIDENDKIESFYNLGFRQRLTVDNVRQMKWPEKKITLFQIVHPDEFKPSKRPFKNKVLNLFYYTKFGQSNMFILFENIRQIMSYPKLGLICLEHRVPNTDKTEFVWFLDRGIQFNDTYDSFASQNIQGAS